MSGFLASLRELYREQMERHRNRAFLRAAMGACAMSAMSTGTVSLGERMRLDQVLETLDALKIFDPHEGVELFNEFVDALKNSTQEGQQLILTAIDEEVAEEPEKAELLIRICLAVSETTEGVPAAERERILDLCRHLKVDPRFCSEQLAST